MSVTNLDLASAGAAIVARLGGQWHDDRGMCLCPAHADRSPSLSVRVGDRSLLFKCFAGCDTLDVLRALRDDRLPVPSRDVGLAISRRSNDEAMRLCALDLWHSAHAIAGTPGDQYLAGRGLPADMRSLRFHPRTPLGRGRSARFLPAIIAAIADGGHIVAIQRLFLEPDGSGLRRDIPNPKRVLGRPLAGAVRLAAAGPTLGLAEGVETATAAARLLGIPVWATLGSERLHQISIPPIVERLVLLPDRDRAGRIASARARKAYADAPFALTLDWPWDGLNDWADVLMRPVSKEGSGVGVAARRAA